MSLRFSSEKNTRLKELLRAFILRYKRDNPGKAINTKTLGEKIGELWELDRKKGQYPTHKLSNLRRNSPQLFAGIRVVESPHSSFKLNTWDSHEGLRKSLKSFVDRFKKNNPGQSIEAPVLHEKVKEIWNLKESGAHKFASLRKYQPEIFAGINIVSAKASAPHNTRYRDDAKFREFFKKNYPNRKWENLRAESGFMAKSLKNTAYRNYLTSLKRGEVIPKGYIRIDAFAKEMGLNLRTLASHRAANNFNAKILKDLFKPKIFRRGVYYEAPTKETKAKYKELYREGIMESRKGMVAKKQAAFTEPIKALYKELRIDPDATPRELSEAIYGNSKARNLQYIGNDASKLTEVLTGSRNLPGFRAPSPLVTQAILANILSPGNGWFNYGDHERRRAMMRERDQILKTKGDKLAQLRFKLRAPGKHLDEAMSLSATYKRAPGYTELAQSIDPAVNMLKGNTIDPEFSRLFEKVITGKEGAGTFRGTKYNNLREHINLFNKSSRDFQKMHGVDTPIIEYQPNRKLLAKDFVKNFKYLSPEAAVNVQELADKGIVLRSKAMPMGEMVKRLFNSINTSSLSEKKRVAIAFGCQGAAEGGRIGYALGSATMNCINTKLTNDPVQSSMKLKATEGIGKVRGAATKFLSLLGRGGVKAAPLAAVAALGVGAEPLVKQFRNDDYSTYLSDPEQQKGMLLSMVEAQTPKVDEEILKWQYPGMAGAAAAAIPGSSAMMKARKAKGFGLPRQALGPVGKFLAGSFSPLGVAATLPINVAAQVKGGSDVEDIATDPFNWLGPAFASTGARMATRGMAPTGILSKAIRMGMSPATLRAGSRFLGMPGLALSAGLTGYDWWKNRGKDKDDEFKVRTYKDDDD